MTTQVVHMRERQPGDVYIGRAGKGEDGYFGNPFRLDGSEPRGATIERFRYYAIARLAGDFEYRERVRALRGKRLVCFCAPLPCHGDVLAELAEALP